MKHTDNEANLVLVIATKLAELQDTNDQLVELVDYLRGQLNNSKRHDLYEYATKKLNKLDEDGRFKDVEFSEIAKYMVKVLTAFPNLRAEVRKQLSNGGLAI